MLEQFVNGEVILWNKVDAQRENRNKAVRKINSDIEEASLNGETCLTVKKSELPKGLLEELKKNFDAIEWVDKIIISWK